MGARLVEFYKEIEDKMGVMGKTRLAMKTAIPSASANDTPDSPENIAKFQAAMKEILS
jgi:hypothetical protein